MLDYDILCIVWWLLIGALLIGFAVTDGRDMGVGALLPFVAANDAERRAVIDSVALRKEMGRIWFVIVGGALVAAWPIVCATAFRSFYWALLAVLWAFLLRPLGFEYRERFASPRWRGIWDWMLFLGGAAPPLIFGIVFGNLLQGVPFYLDEMFTSHYTGTLRTLLNPFALLCGAVSLAMFFFYGGVYLCRHNEGEIRHRAARAAHIAAVTMLIVFSAGGIWVAAGISGYHLTQDAKPLLTPFGISVLYSSGAWLHSYHRTPMTLLLPLLPYFTVAIALWLLRRGRDAAALKAAALALIGVIGTAGAAMFPFIMPSSTHPNHSLTLWNSASSEATLTLMLAVTAVFVLFALFAFFRTHLPCCANGKT